MNIKKMPLLSLLCCVLLYPTGVTGNYLDSLPNIGTAAVKTLSIAQEIEMGDFYSRRIRAQTPMVHDPVLVQYLNSLGERLVNASESVQMPFKFYLLNNKAINAFAFFGGNVVINTGLITSTETESELASVLAHEIAHVTQRHLARAMEQRRQNMPLTIAAALGSILIGLANPEAGMMAISTTLAGTQQSIISFTQSNEQEADRIGIRVLSRAGFDPQSQPNFMRKLADQVRFSSMMPEILMTHPLPNSRITDSLQRANQFSAKKVASSMDYFLAKAKIMAFYLKSNDLDRYATKLGGGSDDEKVAAQYVNALSFYNDKKYSQALTTLNALLQRYPNNAWFIDLATDVDIELSQFKSAITRLEKGLIASPNNAVYQINLANVYIQNKDYDKATNLLHRYTYSHPDDINGWDLLIDTYNKQSRRPEAFSARAELAALNGNFEEAIMLLTNASKAQSTTTNARSRYLTRIDQLKQRQKQFSQYEKR